MNYELLSVIRIGVVFIGAIVALRAIANLRTMLEPGPAATSVLRDSITVGIAFFVGVYSFITSDPVQRQVELALVKPIFIWIMIRLVIALLGAGWRLIFPPPAAGAAPRPVNIWVKRLLIAVFFVLILGAGYMIVFESDNISIQAQNVSGPIESVLKTVVNIASSYANDLINNVEILADQDTQPAQGQDNAKTLPATLTVTSTANIREIGNPDGKLLGTFQQGSTFRAEDYENGWLKLNYDGAEDGVAYVWFVNTDYAS